MEKTKRKVKNKRKKKKNKKRKEKRKRDLTIHSVLKKEYREKEITNHKREDGVVGTTILYYSTIGLEFDCHRPQLS